MKQISIKELNSLMCNDSNGFSAGQTVTYGKYVYRIKRSTTNGVAWIEHMEHERYRKNLEHYNNTSEGWYALLRIA